MKIGLIVAIETDSIFAYYQNVTPLPCPAGFQLYRTEKNGTDIYILRTGMGEIAAASGVQYLISACGAERIVNFGVVGGLTPEMGRQKVCVIDRVVHYKYDCSEFLPLKIGQVDGHDSVYLPTDPTLVEKALAVRPDLKKATCCSGDKFVGTAEEKAHIHTAFEGDVCDMESAGIVLTCEANGVPCLLLKAVSDGLADGAKGFFEELFDASFLCLKTLDEIMNQITD